MCTRSIVVVLLITLQAAVLRADPPALTLQSALSEARQHAPERTVADSTVAAAEARASGAGRRFTNDPVVTGRYQQLPPGGGTDRAWSLGLQWTLDFSGSWRPRRAAARASVTAASQGRSVALLDLDGEVAVAFAELADAQRRVARTAQMVALRELATTTAQRLRTTGAGNQLDVDAAVLDLRAAQVDAATVRGDLEASRVRLARLLGRESSTGLAVGDEIDVTAVPSATMLDNLIALDPRVKLAAAALDAARLLADAENRAARPDVTVGIEGGRARHDIPAGSFATEPSLSGQWSDWDISVSISVPLPLFNRNRVARATTTADVLEAEALLTRVRADAATRLQEARARLVAAIDAVNTAADVPLIIDRESVLLDKALRAGGVELAAFAQQAHRLVEVGRVYDDAVLSLRRARAAWTRLIVQ